MSPTGERSEESLSIGIDVAAVPAAPVGAGQYTLEVVRALSEQDDADLTLFARRDDPARWQDIAVLNTRVIAIAPSSRLKRLYWEERGLGPVARRYVPTLEVLFGPHYSMPANAPIPCVVTVHDLTFVEHPEWHERSKVFVFRRALRIAARHAAGIICVSEHTKQRLLAHFAPRGEVFVVPHGVDQRRFSPREPQPGADQAVLDRLGVTTPFIVHVGTIEPRKDLVSLLRAFERIATRETSCSLVLAGGHGWGSSAVAHELASMQARQRVKLLGYVSNDDVPALLRRASVVAYPSLDEGFGLPTLEALACGAVLVTTKGTAMSELAGDAAITADRANPGGLADALLEGLSAGSAASDRRALGLAIAAERTWQASARGHLEAFHAVVGR